jgi:hypothetical protein
MAAGKSNETGLPEGTERREREEVLLAFGLVKSGNAEVQESVFSHPKESGVAAIH